MLVRILNVQYELEFGRTVANKVGAIVPHLLQTMNASARLRLGIWWRGGVVSGELPKIKHPLGHDIGIADGRFADPLDCGTSHKFLVRGTKNLIVKDTRMY